jgi:DNA-binding transcriptional regulator LsrR (DeoR family)
MARVDELRLMTKVARMYHERQMSQTAIAAFLDLSQATVSRLLKRAERQGIVRISVSVPRGAYPELEERLQATYALKQAIVADCPQDDEETIVRDIGAAAAFYVETTVKPGEVIGISSWSAALLAMVDAMHPLPRHKGATVVQILGGVGNPSAELHASRLTHRLATLVDGKAVLLPAPGVVRSPEAVCILLEDEYVAAAVALFNRVTLALVGIGDVEPSNLLASSGNVFSAAELDMLRRQGAVGDICLRFFDDFGKAVPTPLSERVIGMSLEQLRRVRRAVGVAGGQRKLAAIKGALEGRLINILITDRFTAQALVK